MLNFALSQSVCVMLLSRVIGSGMGMRFKPHQTGPIKDRPKAVSCHHRSVLALSLAEFGPGARQLVEPADPGEQSGMVRQTRFQCLRC